MHLQCTTWSISSTARAIDLSSLTIDLSGSFDAMLLAGALRFCENLEALDVCGHDFGAAGADTLLEALFTGASPCCPKLRALCGHWDLNLRRGIPVQCPSHGDSWPSAVGGGDGEGSGGAGAIGTIGTIAGSDAAGSPGVTVDFSGARHAGKTLQCSGAIFLAHFLRQAVAEEDSAPPESAKPAESAQPAHSAAPAPPMPAPPAAFHLTALDLSDAHLIGFKASSPATASLHAPCRPAGPVFDGLPRLLVANAESPCLRRTLAALGLAGNSLVGSSGPPVRSLQPCGAVRVVLRGLEGVHAAGHSNDQRTASAHAAPRQRKRSHPP
jgi:hypothetical protein